MKRSILILLITIPVIAFSQNLTGTWVGSGSGAHYVKMVLIQKGDSLYGYAYEESHGYCKVDFAGNFSGQAQQLRGRGVSFISKSPSHVLANYNLRYSKSGNEEYLRGSWSLRGVAGILSLGIPAPLYLKKESDHVDTTRYMLQKVNAAPVIKVTPPPPDIPKPLDSPKVVIKKPDTVLIPPQIVIPKKMPRADSMVVEKKQRISKLVETIYTNADTVKMYVYDNGEVDGDTVTVFLDNIIVLDQYRISDKAKELSLPVKQGQSHSIELFANNLGTIPPNTALIIITAGSKRYELRASYDLKTNARIVVEYKE